MYYCIWVQNKLEFIRNILRHVNEIVVQVKCVISINISSLEILKVA